MVAHCSWTPKILPFPFISPPLPPHLSMLVHASKTFRYICECNVCSLANIDRWGEGEGKRRSDWREFALYHIKQAFSTLSQINYSMIVGTN